VAACYDNRDLTWNDLGNGGTAASAVPVATSGNRQFTSIFAGAGLTCGLRADGVAWCRGANSNGQVGTGTNSPLPTPALVVGSHTFTRPPTHPRPFRFRDRRPSMPLGAAGKAVSPSATSSAITSAAGRRVAETQRQLMSAGDTCDGPRPADRTSFSVQVPESTFCSQARTEKFGPLALADGRARAHALLVASDITPDIE
jgi:hypothetical protein